MSAGRAAALAALAGLLHLGWDGLASLAPGAAPPHLLLRYASEFVREVLSPLSVGVAFSVVSGILAVIFLAVVDPAASPDPRRRTWRLALWVYGFWAFSELLLALTWLSAPWGLLLGGIAAGIPRAWTVAWALSRLQLPGGRAARPG